MALKLYDYTLSGSCYKVRLLLDFLELDYEKIQMGFYPAQEHKKPEFLEINPLGQLPVLIDDDLTLRDAQAILCHLANKYDESGKWLPKQAAVFGPVMVWLMFAAGPLMAASAARLHDLLSYDIDIEVARANAHSAFRVLDDHLSIRAIEESVWIMGDAPTIADVACFPYVALAGDGGLAHDEFPAIRNWMHAFRRLPNFDPMPGVPEFG